jgi:glycosyltransferase involved in cell wall biosynthesis
VHLALDTRIFYRYCLTLKEDYEVSLIACHPRRETKSGIPIIPYKRYKNRVFRTLFSWLLVLPKCLQQKAHVYHLHDPELLPLALILQLFGKKVIYDIHENIAEDIFDKEWIKLKYLWYFLYSMLEYPVLKTATIILAEDSYLKRYKNKAKNLHVIHNYCDVSFFKPYVIPADNRNKINLFYSGILLINRGILEIAEAIHIANKKGVHFQFHCVAELYTQVSEALIKLPFYEEIIDQIHFYGRLSLEESYEVSKKCGIGLCIIHPMSNSIESYPTKLFEYMSIGLPSIASDFDLYKEVLENNNCGYTVNPKKPDEIAAQLIRIFESKKTYNTLSENGIKAVNLHYNWKLEVPKLKGIYNSLF